MGKVLEMVTIQESEFTDMKCHVYAIEGVWGILSLTFVTLTNYLFYLKTLNLDDSHIVSLRNYIGQVQNLEHLILSRAEKLVQLPEEIGNLPNLKLLDLRWSRVASLPNNIGILPALTHIETFSY